MIAWRGWMARVGVAVVAVAPAWAWADDYDRWFAVELSGQRAGWMHNVQTTVGGRITTRDEVRFEMGRADSPMSIRVESEFVETKDGKPVSAHAVMRLGATPTVMDAVYEEKGIKVTLTQSGKATVSERPLPAGTWLTPAAANDYVRQRLAAGAEKIVVRTVDPGSAMDPAAMLAPATITHSDCRAESVKAMGKEVKATRCITTSDTQPGVESVEFLDGEGIPVRSETVLGAFKIVAVAADEKSAKTRGAAPEMMVNTFVKPDRRIEGARGTALGVYDVSVPEGKLPALPSTAGQKFEVTGGSTGRLTVDAKHPAAATAEDVKDGAYLAASPMIDSKDEKVKSLAEAAVKGAGADKPERAEVMRKFVHRYITDKDLTVGFGTASETARSKRGDCTEHAVLLAALLRADGIPSRVACGLVYADRFAGASDIFGYHMWTQALLSAGGEQRWVDLDATLSESVPFDATHIALAVTPLADGGSQDALVAIATSIGRLRIKVESVK